RDGAGVRGWITCETRRQAEDVLTERLRQSRQPIRPVVDTNITVAEYAERWLTLVAAGLKPRTVEVHRTALRLHLLPTLGRVKVRLLQKGCQRSPYSEPPGSGKRSHPGSPILSQAGSPMLSHPGAGMLSHPAGG